MGTQKGLRSEFDSVVCVCDLKHQAEEVAAKMTAEGRLRGTIDQVEGILEFENSFEFSVLPSLFLYHFEWT